VRRQRSRSHRAESGGQTRALARPGLGAHHWSVDICLGGVDRSRHRTARSGASAPERAV